MAGLAHAWPANKQACPRLLAAPSLPEPARPRPFERETKLGGRLASLSEGAGQAETRRDSRRRRELLHTRNSKCWLSGGCLFPWTTDRERQPDKREKERLKKRQQVRRASERIASGRSNREDDDGEGGP